MKRRHHIRNGMLVSLALMSIAAGACAQVYKWQDARGVTHYADKPPPSSAQHAEVLKVTMSSSSTSAALPYELARAVQASPVLLYTTARCDACDQGRTLLRERGIPFQERTVNSAEDQQQLRLLGGGSEMPLLAVGSRKLTGFQAAAWHEALSAAAYPPRKMLPPGYRFAAPVAAGATPMAPATPPVRAHIKIEPDAAAAEAAQTVATQPRSTAPAAGNAPPDFQF